MKLTTTFNALASPDPVFDAFHRYKLTRDPGSFFPSKLIRWQFRVLSENVLDVGATYDWKIWLLGILVLAFRERVVEWREGECVAYRAIQGWEMDFRTDLQPEGGITRVAVATDLAMLGPIFVYRLLRPAYEWGLAKVCRQGLSKEGIRTL